MFVADNPAAYRPRIDSNASDMSPLLIPFRYRIGIRLSTLATRRRYRGRIWLLKRCS